jgi:hypothetical protein
MEREKNAGLIVAGLILVLLIIPYSRQVLLFQLGLAVAPSHMLGSLSAPPLAIREHRAPRDADEALLVAKHQAMKSKSIKVFGEMAARFPNEPTLYANMLRYAALSGPLTGPRRPEIEPPAKDLPAKSRFKPLANTPDVRMLENAVKMGRKLEPENSYFFWFEAVLRFQQERDADALAAVHTAALAPGYNAHYQDEFLSEFREYRRRVGGTVYWLTPMSRYAISGAVVLPHFSQFRNAGRMADWYIGQDAKAGKQNQALALMFDQVKFGAVMRDNSLWAMDALVAEAIQSIAVASAYKAFVSPLPHDGTGSKRPTEVQMLRQVQARVPDGLRAADWKYLRNQVARTAEFHTRATACFRGDEYTNGFHLLMWSVWLLVLCGIFLGMVVLSGMSWLVSGFWLGRRGGSDLQAGPRRLSIWLLAILPPLAAMVFATLILTDAITIGGESGFPVSVAVMETIPWVCTAIMGILVSVIAALGIRARDRGERFTTFLARLRAGSAYTAQGMLIVYVVTMIAAMPITARANKAMDQMTNEVQQIWQYKIPGK